MKTADWEKLELLCNPRVRKIVCALNEETDGKYPLRQLAHRVNLKETTTRNLVEKMRDVNLVEKEADSDRSDEYLVVLRHFSVPEITEETLHDT